MPHAELMLSRAFVVMAARPFRVARPVTLEPCSHQGKTPPCSDALISAGTQLVVAVRSGQRVNGAGLSKIAAADIKFG